nr:carboxypeptidase-like regulatory domain-containing protein [Chitinophagaceae bacterium]
MNDCKYWIYLCRKVFLLIMLFFVFFNNAGAQKTNTVKGIVTSADNAPLEGVTVIANPGKKTGTVTNDRGMYSIQVSGNAVLTFSRVGFEKKEINVNNEAVVNLSLDFTNQNMDQVVVVAYG